MQLCCISNRSRCEIVGYLQLCLVVEAWQRPSAPSITAWISLRGRRLNLPLYAVAPPRMTSIRIQTLSPHGEGRSFKHMVCFEAWQRPTLPGPLGPSTIGAGGLNGRVRDGYAWCPSAIITKPLKKSLAGTMSSWMLVAA